MTDKDSSATLEPRQKPRGSRGPWGHWRQEWFAQPKLYASEHFNGHWSWATERTVGRALTVPRLPKRRDDGAVWGVSVVRDELDIIGATVDHLLSQGVDHLLIADHRSADGTREALLERSSRDPRIHVVLDESTGHFQKEKVSRLAREAWRAGAGWVIPFDADELWFAQEGSLREFLHGTSADRLTARTINALPATAEPIGPSSELLLADAEGDAKVAVRAHPLVLIGPGNHGAARVGAATDGLFIAHLPYRSVEQVARKYRNGAQALDAAGAEAFEGWHWRAGARLSSGDLDLVWERMIRGEPVPNLAWAGVNPQLRARVLSWSTWDPQDLLPQL